MKKADLRYFKRCAIVFLTLMAALYITSRFLVIQVTSSTDKGIYLINRYFHTLGTGKSVVFNVPSSVRQFLATRGALPGRLSFFLQKEIQGCPGDAIVIRRGRVYINGRYFQSIRDLGQKDQPVISLANDYFILGGDEYYLGYPHAGSYDSRYFGPVKRAEIIGTVKPLIIWSKHGQKKESRTVESRSSKTH